MTRLQEIKARQALVAETPVSDGGYDTAKMCLIEHAVNDVYWLLDQLEQALDVLKAVEWSAKGLDDFREVPACPPCRGYKKDGHRDNCKLAALIKRLEG